MKISGKEFLGGGSVWVEKEVIPNPYDETDKMDVSMYFELGDVRCQITVWVVGKYSLSDGEWDVYFGDEGKSGSPIFSFDKDQNLLIVSGGTTAPEDEDVIVFTGVDSDMSKEIQDMILKAYFEVDVLEPEECDIHSYLFTYGYDYEFGVYVGEHWVPCIVDWKVLYRKPFYTIRDDKEETIFTDLDALSKKVEEVLKGWLDDAYIDLNSLDVTPTMTEQQNDLQEKNKS